jgi:hypothetical protein
LFIKKIADLIKKQINDFTQRAKGIKGGACGARSGQQRELLPEVVG